MSPWLPSMLTNPRHSALRLLALLLVIGTSIGAGAATLTVGAPRMGPSGWEAPVTMQLAPGENVASMQFDVALPSGFSSGASARASDAALASGKQAMFSEIAPGQVRVVIAGLNQATLTNGAVATLYLGGGAAGQSAPAIGIKGPVLASPTGERVAVRVNEYTPEPEEPEAPADDPIETPEPNIPKEDTPTPVDDVPADDPVGETDGGGITPRNSGLMNGFSGVGGSDSLDSENDDEKPQAATARTAAASNAATPGRSIGVFGNPMAMPLPDAPRGGTPLEPGTSQRFNSNHTPLPQSSPNMGRTNPTSEPGVNMPEGSVAASEIERSEMAQLAGAARGISNGGIVTDSAPGGGASFSPRNHLAEHSGLYLLTFFCMFIVGVLCIRILHPLLNPSAAKARRKLLRGE